jgi:uncharacterized membrane protein
MKIGLILILVLCLPLIFAAKIEYTIGQNSVLVELEMSDKEINVFEFPEDFEYSENKIKYFDKNLIEKSGKEYFFISKSEIYPNSTIKVILPEGAYSNEDYFIFPKNYVLSTNGKNIIMEWKNSGEKEILIPYKTNIEKDYWAYILIILFVVIGIYFYLNNKKNKSKKYTQNLFREERKIMNYLIKNKECWTKVLTKDLDIPKVRLSRKLRKLEEKGLIERIPYGNENKIKLKK